MWFWLFCKKNKNNMTLVWYTLSMYPSSLPYVSNSCCLTGNWNWIFTHTHTHTHTHICVREWEKKSSILLSNIMFVLLPWTILLLKHFNHFKYSPNILNTGLLDVNCFKMSLKFLKMFPSYLDTFYKNHPMFIFSPGG